MSLDSLVVLESNSRWPNWLGEAADAARHVAVVAQRPNEPLSAFRRRATRRMRTLQGRTGPLTATLVCNADPSAERFGSRRCLLQAMLRMMQKSEQGHVVLVADGSYALLRRMAWLASDISVTLDADSRVAVRFRALPRASGAASASPASVLRVA